MRPLNGAPVADGNMGTVVKDLRNQIDVLSRRLSRIPKIPDATPGSMQGFTRAVSFSTNWSTSTATCKGWDFDSTWDASPADKPSLILSTDTVTFGPVEEGWYATHHVATTFAVPAGMLARINFGSAGGGVNQKSYGGRLNLPGGIGGEVVLDHWSGPFWLPATTSGLEPLGLDFQFNTLGGAPSGLLQASVDVWRVG